MRGDVFTRRNLPHWYRPGAVHFVTYRLAGTIPRPVLDALREERSRRLREKPDEEAQRRSWRRRAHARFFADYDRYLDTHRDIDWLAAPRIAALVRQNLYHHDGGLYYLLTYCIMPNHVHALLQPTADLTPPENAAEHDEEDTIPGGPLTAIMRSLKSYTGREANKLLGRSGQFWQRESYDHWVRDGGELQRLIEYVVWNPVKAGLAREPAAWCWGSAHDRFLADGSTSGILRPPVDPCAP